MISKCPHPLEASSRGLAISEEMFDRSWDVGWLECDQKNRQMSVKVAQK